MLFEGCGTALVTPFVDGEIDFNALERLLSAQIDAGIDALVVCGTTGEPSTMTQEEQHLVIRFVTRHVSSVPIIAGIGGNNTREVAEAAKAVEQLGVDAALAVTPYYNKTTQEGLLAHYFTVADASSLPVVLYNVPARTGVNIAPQTALRLSEHDRIVALKEANPDLDQLMADAALLRGRLTLYSGNDDRIYPMMMLGASGVISVASNLIPAQVRSIVASYLDGHSDESLDLQFRYGRLFELLFAQVSPIPVKAALAATGMMSPEVRLPLVTLSPKELKPLFDEMTALGLL